MILQSCVALDPTSALNTGEALLPEWGKTNGQNDKIVDDKLEPIT